MCFTPSHVKCREYEATHGGLCPRRCIAWGCPHLRYYTLHNISVSEFYSYTEGVNYGLFCKSGRGDIKTVQPATLTTLDVMAMPWNRPCLNVRGSMRVNVQRVGLMH